jgi:Flp pilus assembly protein TadG
VLVESALVIPILLMLIAAVVDFGLALNDSQSVRQGAMDGARQTAVNNIGTYSCPLTSMGAGWASAASVACLTKTRTNISNAASVRVGLAFQVSGTCNSGGAASVSAPCSKKGDPIAVCVQYPVTSASGMFNFIVAGSQAKTEIVERLEKDAKSAPTAGFVSETAPEGGTWSWCANPTA